ncbi:MAG: MGMT family protein [Candidatus Woesearchaeota archaeon]|nr:MGMT family protein [Candidatus Woesearchaeota archaeon]
MTFTQKIWQLARKIPKGKVTTYKIIAKKLGTRAYRAVGNALNKNRSKKVPCHRVVRSDGYVGGFAGGTKEKIRLLKKEGIKIKGKKIINFEDFLYWLR